MADKNTLKEWFSNGKKPSQEQFWQWQDSYFHKDDLISQDKVEGLEIAFNRKADDAIMHVHFEDEEAHGLFKKANKADFEDHLMDDDAHGLSDKLELKADQEYVSNEINRLDTEKLNSVSITGGGVTADLSDKINPKFTIESTPIIPDGKTLSYGPSGELQYGKKVEGTDNVMFLLESGLTEVVQMQDLTTRSNREYSKRGVFCDEVTTSAGMGASLFEHKKLDNAKVEISTLLGLRLGTGAGLNAVQKTIGFNKVLLEYFANDIKDSPREATHTVEITKDRVSVNSVKTYQYLSTVTFASKRTTEPPIVIANKALTVTPVNGGIENDGDNLYFTAKGIRTSMFNPNLRMGDLVKSIFMEWSTPDDVPGVFEVTNRKAILGPGGEGYEDWWAKASDNIRVDNIYVIERHTDHLNTGRRYEKIEIVIEVEDGPTLTLPFIDIQNGTMPQRSIYSTDMTIRLLTTGYVYYIVADYNRYTVGGGVATVERATASVSERDETNTFPKKKVRISMVLRGIKQDIPISTASQDFLFYNLRMNISKAQ